MRIAGACACCACPRPTTSARRSIRSIVWRKSKAAWSWASARRCTKRWSSTTAAKCAIRLFSIIIWSTSLDIPELISIIVECAEPEGPYGAKGLGEPGLAPTPAAIGNAVADATGVRVYDLPLKPENVYWAIQNKKKKTAA